MATTSIAHRGLFAFAFVLGLAANAPTAQAAGTLSSVASYNDGSVKLDFDDYVDGPKVVALMGMKGNGVSISFAFDKAEWPNLLSLWTKAVAKSGSDYATAGSLKEVGSSAECVITMAGGPAVRITIVAELGEMVKNENGSYLLLQNGSIQRHETKQRDPNIVEFDRYAFVRLPREHAPADSLTSLQHGDMETALS